ncbi:aspartate aminotransferase family protein [Polyangium sorediatum]|uniref:Aspartate aminotransferase family protein n=1 Tax=Polyangium sorediatum TaxID=889274 RepID=A0ABT6NKN2_9BACT|nr:aspartate aminotransferase family protein [Polyangium sorediatum]MDI1428833.1 aspartate aminotransferase family protein [Polyangium sorediatum]
MTPMDHAEILRKGIEDFRRFVNPLVAARVVMTGEPHRMAGTRDGKLVEEGGQLIEDLHGTQSLGHRVAAVADAVRDWLATDAPSWYPSRVNPYAGRLGRALFERTGYDNAFFGMSGSDAVEAAMKLARAATGRPRVLSLLGAYHGTTMGSCALMNPGMFRDPFAPHLPDVAPVPREDVDALARALASDDVAAIIVEPIQLEGGVFPLSERYIAALCELTEAHGTLLVADEVQTGLGRLGRFLGTSTWPRRPDVIVLAKALGGGLLPCSAMLTRKEIFLRAYGKDMATAEAHNVTFGGNAMSCVAALAMLDLLSPEVLAVAKTRGDHFQAALGRGLAGSPLVVEVRGAGLIAGVELTATDHPWLSFEHFGMEELHGHSPIGLLVCHRMYKRGYYCFVCGHRWNTLRLQPRLDISEAEIDAFVAALRAEIDSIAELV